MEFMAPTMVENKELVRIDMDDVEEGINNGRMQLWVSF